MGVRSLVVLCFALFALAAGGCWPLEDDEEQQPAGSQISADVQAATQRLEQYAQQQMQAVQQAQSASTPGQVGQAVDQLQSAQQQAVQPVQTLQEAQSQQALADYYAARAEHNRRMAEIIRQQREEAERRSAEAARDRLDQLYEEQRAYERRQAEEAAGYP